MESKSSSKILVPILIAIIFVAGIYLGTLFSPKQVQGHQNVSVNSKFSTILETIEDRYVDSVDHEMLVESSIFGMIKKLDPHSSYIPPKDLETVNEQLDGKFGGVGIRFLIHDDTLVVTHVLPNSPSEEAGLYPGDRIIQVDDSVIVDNVNNKKVMSLLKGQAGTNVELVVLRKGLIKNITITRGTIPISSIDTNVMLTKSIGFIKLNSFTYDAGDEFVAAAQELKEEGMTKLIFDLRNNGGGFMHAATQIIDQFLPSGKLMVYTKGRKVKQEEYFSTSKGILQDVEVIVLINTLSASASEIVAGAIQDNDRGFILGRRSFGKGLVQDQQEFNDGSALRLTISRYYTPTGRCIQKPYGEGVDYENDYLNRYESGELMNEDSVKFDESLKFTTEGGRTVYGGGGIYPDIFIPNDTLGASYYLTSLYYGGAFNHWAFKFLDNKRSKWKTFSEFNKSFNVSDGMLAKFANYAESKLNVKKDNDGYNRSNRIIKNRLKAEIARHLFEENGYYQIYLKDDLDVQTALKELN
jgi:carboxyl-terminal processing protease